jgi:predicted ribosomally synthesized peptide with SipW-like signal peptide
MKFRLFASGAISSCLRSWRLWLVQFFGNPALFGLFALWLLIPVARGWQLAVNVLVALLFLAGILVLHGGTMSYFNDREDATKSQLAAAFLGALRNFLPVVILAAVTYFFWMLLGRAEAFHEIYPAYVRSSMPAYIRRLVTLHFLTSLFAATLFVARWILVPGLLLPFFVQAARSGFRVLSKSGLSAWAKSLWSVSYWAFLAVAAVVGVLVPSWLMDAKPDFRTSTFNLEMSSLIIRLSFAYLLGLTVWMLTCSLVGRHVRRSGGVGADVSGNASA